MTRISLLAASAALVFVGGITAASASTPGAYITGEAGASIIPNQDVSHTRAGTLEENLAAAPAYGGALGYDFGNGTRIELDSLTTEADIDSLNGLKTHGHIDATGLMLNGKVDLMQNALFTPYVGAGIGFQDVGAKVAGMQGENWEPAYQLEAGLRHKISDDLSLFGEYRFTQSEASKISGGGMTGHQHFTNNAVIAGLTYHFGD